MVKTLFTERCHIKIIMTLTRRKGCIRRLLNFSIRKMKWTFTVKVILIFLRSQSTNICIILSPCRYLTSINILVLVSMKFAKTLVLPQKRRNFNFSDRQRSDSKRKVHFPRKDTLFWRWSKKVMHLTVSQSKRNLHLKTKQERKLNLKMNKLRLKNRQGQGSIIQRMIASRKIEEWSFFLLNKGSKTNLWMMSNWSLKNRLLNYLRVGSKRGTMPRAWRKRDSNQCIKITNQWNPHKFVEYLVKILIRLQYKENPTKNISGKY